MLVRIFQEGYQIFGLNGKFLIRDPVGADWSDISHAGRAEGVL